jgi:hypothetical protein
MTVLPSFIAQDLPVRYRVFLRFVERLNLTGRTHTSIGQRLPIIVDQCGSVSVQPLVENVAVQPPLLFGICAGGAG